MLGCYVHINKQLEEYFQALLSKYCTKLVFGKTLVQQTPYSQRLKNGEGVEMEAVPIAISKAIDRLPH